MLSDSQVIELLQKMLRLLENISQKQRELSDRLDDIERQIRQEKPKKVESDRIDKYEAAELVKCHTSTLFKYRNNYWIEGIHYFRVGGKSQVQYSRSMLNHWVENAQSNPEAHQRLIEQRVKEIERDSKMKRRAV